MSFFLTYVMRVGVLITLFSAISIQVINSAQAESDAFKEKLALLERFLSRIPADVVMSEMIANQKLLFLQALLLGAEPVKQVENKSDEDTASEDMLFAPKKPKKLILDAKYKSRPLKETILERISEKFIGDIPEQVKDMAIYYSNYDHHKAHGTIIYNRVLLHGKPGTGKSFLAEVVAHELQVPAIFVGSSVFGDKYIGQSSRKIRRLFELAKEVDGPVIIFIDEIDAIASQRTGHTHEEHRGTLITLLTELQAIQSHHNIYVIVATNVDPFYKEKDTDMVKKTVLDTAVQDRFASSIAEVKQLDEKGKTKLLLKIFKDLNIDTRNSGENNETKEKANEKCAARLAQIFNSNFSNRDIECIVTMAEVKRKNAYLADRKDEKHFCHYIRKAFDTSGKKGSFSWTTSTYCDGI